MRSIFFAFALASWPLAARASTPAERLTDVMEEHADGLVRAGIAAECTHLLHHSGRHRSVETYFSLEGLVVACVERVSPIHATASALKTYLIPASAFTNRGFELTPAEFAERLPNGLASASFQAATLRQIDNGAAIDESLVRDSARALVVRIIEQ